MYFLQLLYIDQYCNFLTQMYNRIYVQSLKLCTKLYPLSSHVSILKELNRHVHYLNDVHLYNLSLNFTSYFSLFNVKNNYQARKGNFLCFAKIWMSLVELLQVRYKVQNSLFGKQSSRLVFLLYQRQKYLHTLVNSLFQCCFFPFNIVVCEHNELLYHHYKI